jgi:hypothetical protein
MWAKDIQKKSVTAGTSSTKFASLVDQKLASMKNDGSTESTGRRDTRESMFNGQGILNASDKRDAFKQMDKFASGKASMKVASSYTPQEQQAMIKAALGDSNENTRFASDMVPLILERLDYEGFGRQLLMTQEVGQGQIISYEKDVFPTALVVNSDGKGISTVIKGDREFIPEFTIAAFPTITMQEVATRQFDIIDRLHDKTFREIQKQEDRNISKLLYQGSTMANTQLAIPGAIDKTVLENIRKKVENHQLIVDKFIMHRDDYSDLLNGANIIDLEPVLQREILTTGIWATLYGVKILVSAGQDEGNKINQTVPKGVVFATTAGRYLGTMPIRQELMVMNADKFVNNELAYGWAYAEIVGQSILNYRAVACGVKTSAVIPTWLK